MDAVSPIVRLEIRHGDYNLDQLDNLGELPEEPAVFGIFAIINDQPVNCRYVGETENLRGVITSLFESPPGEGLRQFMQGPWIKMLLYEKAVGLTNPERQSVVSQWARTHKPAVDREGNH